MKKTANAWIHDMAQALGSVVDDVPKGWLTTSQIRDELSVSIGQAETFIRRALRAGQMQKKQFNIRCASGIKTVWHYAPKNLAS